MHCVIMINIGSSTRYQNLFEFKSYVECSKYFVSESANKPDLSELAIKNMLPSLYFSFYQEKNLLLTNIVSIPIQYVGLLTQISSRENHLLTYAEGEETIMTCQGNKIRKDKALMIALEG